MSKLGSITSISIAVNPDNRIATDGTDALLGTQFYNGNFYVVASDAATAADEAAARGGSLMSPEAGQSTCHLATKYLWGHRQHY